MRPFHSTLSGLRGIAALCVVMLHLQPYFKPFSDPMGYAAVDLFFVLSGSVVAAAYGDRLRRGLGFWRFLLIRLIRLYPLYLLGTILTLLAALHATNQVVYTDPRAAIKIPLSTNLLLDAFLMLPALTRAPIYPYDPPAWSLFFELLANIMYGAVGWRARGPVLISILAASFAYFAFCANQGLIGILPAMIARVTFCHFAGVLIQQLPKPAATLPAWALMMITAAILFERFPVTLSQPVYVATIGLILPTLVYFSLHVEPRPTHRRAWNFLGQISYPLYIIHVPLAMLIISNIPEPAAYGLLQAAPLSGPLLLAAAAVTSWLLDRYFDHPIRGLLNRLAGRLIRHHLPG
jgi:peptidoglycan/LPS O-acetylase OafA/YrhL